MKHVVVDLEMNRISKHFKEERSICNMEIIEIGAVLLDEQYQEIGSFKTLVKPEFNEVIEPYYSRLTGITTEMVANAPHFYEALNMFLSWCKSVSGELQFYQWSETDISQIRKEIEMKHISIDDEFSSYLDNWVDFQKEYVEKLGLSNALSLQNAVMYAGVEFEGQPHDALNDARNTGALMGILRDPDKCKNTLEYVMDALKPKEIASTLGDMFDFSKFVFAS